MKIYFKLLLVLLSLSLFYKNGICEKKGILLVENKKEKTVIVIPEKPTSRENKSATIINEHIQKITGVKLPVLKIPELGEIKPSIAGIQTTGNKWENFNFVLIGNFDFFDKFNISLEKLGPEGMIVKTLGNTVIVSGKDEGGLRHATYAFLEELGCRYLWPGETGKVIPKKETLYIQETDIREEPKLVYRNIRDSLPTSPRLREGAIRIGLNPEKYAEIFIRSMQSGTLDDGWFAWHKMGSHREFYRGHSFGDYWKKYGKEHPEWFALQPSGTRDQSLSPERARLCHSNRELINEIIKNKIQELEKNPKQEGVSICLNDGGYTTFCLCENCRKLDPPEGSKIKLSDYTTGTPWEFEYVSLTDRVLWFSNQIAEGLSKVFPDKHLGFYAYSCYSAPPLKIKPHPNLVIFLVPGTYTSENGRQQALKYWNDWAKYGNKVFWRPNCLLANRRYMVPQNFSHKICEDMKYFYNKGMVGTDFDSCLHHWALMGLTYYVLAKAHWNPDKINVDFIIDDYCEKGFGEASKYIKQYFQIIEEVTDEAARKEVSILEIYNEDILKKLKSCLEKAEEISKTIDNKEVYERVKFLQTGLKFGELQIKKYKISQLKEDDKSKKEMIETVNKEWVSLLKTIAEESPLAVNVPAVVYYQGMR